MHFKLTEIFLSKSENSIFKFSRYEDMRSIFKDDRFIYII